MVNIEQYSSLLTIGVISLPQHITWTGLAASTPFNELKFSNLKRQKHRGNKILYGIVKEIKRIWAKHASDSCRVPLGQDPSLWEIITNFDETNETTSNNNGNTTTKTTHIIFHVNIQHLLTLIVICSIGSNVTCSIQIFL